MPSLPKVDVSRSEGGGCREAQKLSCRGDDFVILTAREFFTHSGSVLPGGTRLRLSARVRWAGWCCSRAARLRAVRLQVQ